MTALARNFLSDSCTRTRKHSAIFGEYRYTHVRAETVFDGAITGAHIPMRFDLNTHHFVTGVSFRF